jgi:hypothetical protein
VASVPRNRTGAEFEWDLARYFNEHGFPKVEPRRTHGRYDKGDLAGVPDHVVEAKARRAIDLAGAITEAEVERRNAGERWKVAVFKRRNHSIGKAYVVMELDQWIEYLHELTGLKIDG